MKQFFIGFFICLLWFFAGAWVYICVLKARCSEDSDKKTSVQADIQDYPEPTENENRSLPLDDAEVFPYHKTLYFYFDSEKHQINAELEQYIVQLKKHIATYPDKKIKITGHTDNVGTPADNQWIGMQRAKNAMKYLVSQGIDASHISVLSEGESQPIATNNTKEGRRRNRRVDITIIN